MAITASLVKELRERTGSGMMECKKALVETEGDIEDINSTDVAIAFGGGLDFSLGSTLMSASARYNIGLSNIIGDAGLYGNVLTPGLSEETVKNSVWSFLLSFTF